MPLTFRPLLRGEDGHHDNVERSGLPVGVRVGDHVFVNEDLAVSRCHGQSQVCEDRLALSVGPVVENRMHVVCPGAWGINRYVLKDFWNKSQMWMRQLVMQTNHMTAILKEGRTFNRLLFEKVMLHGRYIGADDLSRILDDIGQIL